ncbi:YbaY family lipoprotein [Thioalkalivibrio sp.]|uniref:YbaY family lipoprotein n=1 Tax=Thioalkalivibrio sp. TaxID=2093813 RepID=UPI003977157F
MRVLLSALVLLALVGCATTASEPEVAEVSGEAIYFERIAAPPNARLEVVLQDISRPGRAAERLGEMILENAGQPPYAFSIPYDPAQIDPRHSYSVAARLYDGDDLLFVTDQVHQVITRGFPSTATLKLRRVGSTPAQPLGELPATFKGTLPCADCPGIDYHLNLLDEGVYFLRQNYQDREGGPFDDIGRYLLSSDRDQLTLYGGREAPLRLAISGPDTLRLLDRDGGHIESELNYDLSRQPALQPLEPRLLLGGMYRYLADAGRFQECLTGLNMPVATEADHRALEKAYLAARERPGEALLVSLEGQIAQRMPMEGPGPVATLVPERFIGVWPEQGCPPPIKLADLKNTYWRLSLLDSEGVQRAPDQREPHLVFHEEDRLAGSDGCNRIVGAYALEDASIELSMLATTRMACLEGMAQARRFLETLEEVSQYRIIGRHLEMLDESGNLRLRFEAVALY